MMIITRMEDKVLRFKKFFDLNFPKVKTFAWQLLKSEEDAEDIAQDIFVKLWEKPDLWLEREKLDSYLYTVVRNHIYNFLKHKAVEYDYLDVAAEKMRMAELGLPTPDDEFCAHELELFVQMALERMPEQRRRVFLMSREEGMTSPEIAEKLNVSVRTVEQHIYKALQDLKKIILFLLLPYRILLFCLSKQVGHIPESTISATSTLPFFINFTISSFFKFFKLSIY